MAGRCVAHILPAHGNEGERIQTAAQHCRETAVLAAGLLKPVQLEKTGYLSGLVHDMGKFTSRFEDYIRKAAAGAEVRRGSVNHTFAGVRFLLTRYHGPGCGSIRDVACELLAYAAGAHHGLYDCVGLDGSSGFLHRMEKEDICYREARSNFLSQCAGEDELDMLFEQSVQEVEALHGRLLSSAKGEAEGAFLYGTLCRLVLSALIDADRRDTASFMGGPAIPLFPDDLRPIWKSRLEQVEGRLSAFSADSPIALARRDISAQCRAFASRGKGIYRLCVPTGGGKTLSALRYALAHAADQGKRRILFLIPLLSVLDQNARVIRDYVDNDHLILEHHSNLVHPDEGSDQLDPQELLAENWASPIVISTLVQFLNTLFLGKTTAIRRMCALCGSVIVIDEVQSVPRSMLSQFNLALNFLSEICGATVVLCSATQPCLEALEHPLHYSPAADMVPYAAPLWNAFERTQVQDRRIPGGYSLDELAGFAGNCLERFGNLLLICNTKGQAKALFERLKGTGLPLYHLSTAMCPKHRSEALAEIVQRLAHRQPVLCVATQLVEAGIDFSFRSVIRMSAGMDNVAQAAGRCNRSGEAGCLCPVYIVNLRGEELGRLPEIRHAQVAAEELLSRYERDPGAFGRNLLSDQAIGFYYRRLFSEMRPGAADYPLPALDTTLLDLLSQNRALGLHSPVCRERRYYLNQAFGTAGKEFQVFPSHTVDLLLPYGEGEECIAGLASQRAEWDLAYCKWLLDRAKPYTVSVFDYQARQLAGCGGLRTVGTVQVLLPQYYDKETGLTMQPGAIDFMEV